MSRREIWILTLLVCLLAAAYAISGLVNYRHFEAGSDLAIFDQALWHLSRFESPASTISGFSNILADHFYPILGLFAPLYWIFPGPSTLVVAQAMLLASSMVPVFVFLRDRLPSNPALALTLGYGLFWGMQRTAAFDVHEFAFAPLFIATLLLAMSRRRWRLFWMAALSTALVKEDLIPFVGFVGVYLLFRGERRQGAWLLVLSVAVFLVLVAGVMPRIGDTSGYRYTGLYETIAKRPWMIPVTLVTPVVKLRTTRAWLGPFVLLPLLSPLSTLLIPLVLERLLSTSPNHWGVIYHYTAPLAPILAMSAGDGLARLAGRIPDPKMRSRSVVALAGLCVLVSAIVPGHQPLWRSLKRQSDQATAVYQTGYQALRQIPPSASVVAQTPIASHLSERDRIFLLTPKAPDTDFIVAARGLAFWPLEGPAELDAFLEARRGRGYEVIFEGNSWVVLRRR